MTKSLIYHSGSKAEIDAFIEHYSANGYQVLSSNTKRHRFLFWRKRYEVTMGNPNIQDEFTIIVLTSISMKSAMDYLGRSFGIDLSRVPVANIMKITSKHNPL